MKAPSNYQHPNAGTVYRVYGIQFDGALGEQSKIELYRIGEKLHEINGDLPQGVVSVEPSDQPVIGWGLVGPVVKVTSPNGWEIICEKTDIEKIK